MMNKNNVPYYIAGTLATFTLLASGVFAAAPYIGFLAPVAALSVGLPFIIGYAVFSVVTIALSYKAISENKTISEKDAQLAKKEDKVQAQEQENSELEKKVKAQEEENSEQKTQLAEKNKKIEEDKLKVAIADGTVQLAKGTVNSAVWFAKEAVNGVLYSGKYAYDNYVPSTESTKGTLSGIGGGLKNTCDASIASVRGALNSVGSGLKNTCDTSIESAKGTISSVGNKLKNVYDTMPSTKIEFSWVSEKFSPYWNSVKNLMFGNKADQASGASQLSSESQGNGIVIPEGAKLELSPILFDFLFREKQKMVRQFLREQTDEKKNVATQENLKTETPSQENQMNIDNVPR